MYGVKSWTQLSLTARQAVCARRCTVQCGDGAAALRVNLPRLGLPGWDVTRARHGGIRFREADRRFAQAASGVLLFRRLIRHTIRGRLPLRSRSVSKWPAGPPARVVVWLSRQSSLSGCHPHHRPYGVRGQPLTTLVMERVGRRSLQLPGTNHRWDLQIFDVGRGP